MSSLIFCLAFSSRPKIKMQEKKYITPLSVPSTMNHGLSRKSTNQQTTVQYTRKYLNNHCSPSFLSFFLSQSPNQFFSLKKRRKKLTLTYLLIVINYRCGIFTFISSAPQCLLYIKKGFSVKQYRYVYLFLKSLKDCFMYSVKRFSASCCVRVKQTGPLGQSGVIKNFFAIFENGHACCRSGIILLVKFQKIS